MGVVRSAKLWFRLKDTVVELGRGNMGEEPKDPLKGVDWKAKIREIPDYYFLPRRSLPSAIAFYGACIAAGIGAGMLLELWMNDKLKKDGGVIWEFDK